MNANPLDTLARSPYLEGVYAPVHDELTLDLDARGLPLDLEGTFVRNGANPRLAPKGRYHWFDGDGMVHAVELGGGRATYRNRYVRTDAFVAEAEAGEPLWTGILEPVDLKNPRGPFKDTANTDLVFHAGKLLALWWQTGVPYVLSLPDLATSGKELFGAAHKAGISAHPKVDPVTGEMMFMTFGMRPPYLAYGVIDAAGKLSHYTPIESVPGPRYQHDIAITERHTILMDLPMYADPKALAQGKSRVGFHRDQPARFGVIPRRGRDADVKWFEAEPCYVYHTINAWEEGHEIVMIGCRIADPLMGDPNNPKDERVVPSIALQRLEPYMHEWRFDLTTGKTKERRLSDTLGEFPRMDNRRLGRRSRYSFVPRIAPSHTLAFDGLVKVDHETGREIACAYPKGWVGGEAVVAPRTGSTAEDDAYVVTFMAHADSGESALWVWSARDFGEPIAKVGVGARVPAGYHAWWVSAEQARNGATR
jgi:carotenoid cleavage dioxygenase-like enzyme